jgi:hypothetical protein
MGLPVILWALAAFVTLLQLHPLVDHHVVLLSPALALISGYGAFAALQAFTAEGRQRAGLALTALLLVLAGAGLVTNGQRTARELPARELSMVLALQSVSTPEDVVLSDDQYLAALANRDVPPELVDTSVVRISNGYLTTAELENSINRHGINVILFASGRFHLLPEFRAWVAQRYTQVATFEYSGALFLRDSKSNDAARQYLGGWRP